MAMISFEDVVKQWYHPSEKIVNSWDGSGNGTAFRAIGVDDLERISLRYTWDAEQIEMTHEDRTHVGSMMRSSGQMPTRTTRYDINLPEGASNVRVASFTADEYNQPALDGEQDQFSYELSVQDGAVTLDMNDPTLVRIFFDSLHDESRPHIALLYEMDGQTQYVKLVGHSDLEDQQYAKSRLDHLLSNGERYLQKWSKDEMSGGGSLKDWAENGGGRNDWLGWTKSLVSRVNNPTVRGQLEERYQQLEKMFNSYVG